MTLWEEIQPWIDKETGLMTAPDGGRDNLILMTAYLASEMIDLPEVLRDAIWKFRQETQVAQGLLLRKPNDFSRNSVDNLIGGCYLSAAYAVEVRIRWERYFTCFDITAPYKVKVFTAVEWRGIPLPWFDPNFYGKFLGLKTYIDARAGHIPNLLERLIWIGANYFTDWTSKGASDRLLMWLQVDTMSAHCPKTCTRWARRNPRKALYKEYFGANFPLAHD